MTANDHSHVTLWLMLMLTMMGSFNHCNVGYQELERENARLRGRVQVLETECVRK